MDFNLSPEVQTVRDRVRDFIRREIVPLEAHADEEGLPADALAEVRGKARAAGVWAPQLPREYGGLGLETVALCGVFQEAGWSPLGPQATSTPPADSVACASERLFTLRCIKTSQPGQ